MSVTVANICRKFDGRPDRKATVGAPKWDPPQVGRVLVDP